MIEVFDDFDNSSRIETVQPLVPIGQRSVDQFQPLGLPIWEAALKLLTDEQQEKWKKAKGETFELPRRRRKKQE